MSIVYFLVPCALFLGLGFTLAFVWMVRRGQFDELETPAYRILLEEESEK